jgi:hypothetical protein
MSPLTRTDQLYDDLSQDPRGVAWMWEPPRKNAAYVMGIDPTVGITGWSRHSRVANDSEIDRQRDRQRLHPDRPGWPGRAGIP